MDGAAIPRKTPWDLPGENNMKCSKCGRDWPSEYYFHVPEQCIFCDKEEGIVRKDPYDTTPEKPDKQVSMVRIIKAVLYLGYGFLWVVLFLIIVFGIGVLVSGRIKGVDLPLLMSATHIDGFIQMNSPNPVADSLPAFMSSGVVEVHLGEHDWPYMISLVFIVLIEIGVSLFILHQLLNFLDEVTNARLFVRQNAAAIRKIGWVVALYAPVAGLIQYLMTWALIDRVRLTGATLGFGFYVDISTVFLGLIIVVIAQIFDEGVKLKEEHDLTI